MSMERTHVAEVERDGTPDQSLGARDLCIVPATIWHAARGRPDDGPSASDLIESSRAARRVMNS